MEKESLESLQKIGVYTWARVSGVVGGVQYDPGREVCLLVSRCRGDDHTVWTGPGLASGEK